MSIADKQDAALTLAKALSSHGSIDVHHEKVSLAEEKQMKKTILLVTLVLCSTSVCLAQQKMYEPEKGSAERKALMAAIRVYDVARNSQLGDEIFSVTALKVQGNWAFASVERNNLLDAEGGTRLAFLRKSGGVWKVMWSDYNDNSEVGVDALKRLRQKHQDFKKELATFAESHLAG